MKIFVSIASYCDELLFFTLRDCYQKAEKPENLVFAVIDQNDASQKDAIDALSFADQIRYVYINKMETFGVSWARNMAFSLFDNEEYLLQIDSHTYFEQGWDDNLLTQYTKILEKSAKPILSVYPYAFCFDADEQPVFTKPTGEFVMELRPHPDTSLTDDCAVLRFRAGHVKTTEPVNGCHIAAGFIFTKSAFIEEIPYDPYLYFHGEEQSLSVRAYTRGWDIYHPTWIPLYHHYKESGVSYTNQHWHESVRDKRRLKHAQLKQRSQERVNRLFYGDGMLGSAYGLGQVRSLGDFIRFSGIDYFNKKIIR
ncbi:GlcNAc-transferase family protein [Marinomonas sp. 2405UD68-3]|uniref:GlcNAc-transferase family protein n=1 Tax=Marinomonas sp. 2405UD68-3 TaxID=3391835 RepID=UPI0039C98D57